MVSRPNFCPINSQICQSNNGVTVFIVRPGRNRFRRSNGISFVNFRRLLVPVLPNGPAIIHLNFVKELGYVSKVVDILKVALGSVFECTHPIFGW